MARCVRYPLLLHGIEESSKVRRKEGYDNGFGINNRWVSTGVEYVPSKHNGLKPSPRAHPEWKVGGVEARFGHLCSY